MFNIYINKIPMWPWPVLKYQDYRETHHKSINKLGRLRSKDRWCFRIYINKIPVWSIHKRHNSFFEFGKLLPFEIKRFEYHLWNQVVSSRINIRKSPTFYTQICNTSCGLELKMCIKENKTLLLYIVFREKIFSIR